MKKWSGGMFIMALAMIMFLGYSLIVIRPQKQLAYSFFRNHPTNDSHTQDSDFVKPSQMEMEKASKQSKKPPLIEIDGLSDLYAPKNISEEESKTLLVWTHMRMLLSRSDGLPEGAEGVKEASVAWKELFSTIEKEKASKFSNSNNTEDKNCPYSVSTLDKIALYGGVVLELPCGLVEGSSITVVGIPDGRHRSFQIELVGSQLSGEPTPPIILHYNVSLPGDNMTEEPLIVQNTWTGEAGWGTEERCPAHGSAYIVNVDGLVLCNEQIVRSTMEENMNVSHPSSETLTNVQRRSAHGSSSFPFVEGSLFTATLWVGLEGFHMTVSGRHETSFAYREE